MFGNWFSQVRKTFKLNFVSRKTFLWNVSPGQNHRHSWSICSVSEIPDVSLRDCSSEPSSGRTHTPRKHGRV